MIQQAAAGINLAPAIPHQECHQKSWMCHPSSCSVDLARRALNHEPLLSFMDCLVSLPLSQLHAILADCSVTTIGGITNAGCMDTVQCRKVHSLSSAKVLTPPAHSMSQGPLNTLTRLTTAVLAASAHLLATTKPPQHQPLAWHGMYSQTSKRRSPTD